jgi:hypothetical protein
MATQTLEFNAATGLTISVKLFARGSDTVVDTQAAVEKTNDKNRYSVAFTDAPTGEMRINGFVGSVGGFANEVYDLVDATATFFPRSEVGGGGGAVNVLPLSGIVESRVDGTTISVFTSETPTVSIAVVDGEGNALTVTSLTLSLVIERRATADLVVIADASITKSGSTISFVVPSQVTSAEGHHRWSLRDTADDSVLLQGPFIVTYAPTVDG